MAVADCRRGYSGRRYMGVWYGGCGASEVGSHAWSHPTAYAPRLDARARLTPGRGEAVSYAAVNRPSLPISAGARTREGFMRRNRTADMSLFCDACLMLISSSTGPPVREWQVSRMWRGAQARAGNSRGPASGACFTYRCSGAWTSARCRDGTLARVRRPSFEGNVTRNDIRSNSPRCRVTPGAGEPAIDSERREPAFECSRRKSFQESSAPGRQVIHEFFAGVDPWKGCLYES